jgi:hypothetical protein
MHIMLLYIHMFIIIIIIIIIIITTVALCIVFYEYILFQFRFCVRLLRRILRNLSSPPCLQSVHKQYSVCNV